MTYTNDEIKVIAEQQLANSDWKDENQKADTTFGFRMGFGAAIRLNNLHQASRSTIVEYLIQKRNIDYKAANRAEVYQEYVDLMCNVDAIGRVLDLMEEMPLDQTITK